MGVAHLYNQGLDIPCDYYNITYDKKDGEYSFKVMSSSVGDWELYTPSNINITQYRDKGEQLFAQEKYSEAIEYYKDSLMTSPIAKLYTGISLNKLANRQILYIPLFCESVEGGSYFKVDAIRKNTKKKYLTQNWLCSMPKLVSNSCRCIWQNIATMQGWQRYIVKTVDI